MNAQPELHPTDQTLHAYGLGQLDDASAEAVNAHLEGCPDCRQRVAALTSDTFLGRLRDAQARPESFRPAVSSTDGLSMLATGPAPAAPPPAGTLPPGLADLPNYEILRELGQGGMGTVFLARNTLMGRTEVLKVVSGHLVNRRGIIDRFLGEIRNAAKLHHPNIVAAYTAHQLGESLVLAMEYVEGLDLSRLVKAKGPLPVANSCTYVHQAALGLQHAHEHGMVHRDIKPSNLMLAKQGNRGVVKVLDFGLAKVTSEGAVDAGLTHEGQMLGTPDYIAPEQISNARRADIRADIYSLGCTLYYLLAGKPPFRGDSLYDILQAHHSMDARPLNLVRPEVSVELAALVAKMMAKEPERRFQTPKELAQALAPFFKKGESAFKGPVAQVSVAAQAGASQTALEMTPPPTQSATHDPRRAAPSKTMVEEPLPNTEWKTLIDVQERDVPRETKPALAPWPRQRWVWPSVAAGLFFVGLLVLWGVVLRIKTANGTIELVDLPRDAEVFVDGVRVDVVLPAGSKRPVITVTAEKKHRITVKSGETEISADEVTVQADGVKPFTVRSIPNDSSPPSRADAGSRASQSDVVHSPAPPPDQRNPSTFVPPVAAGNADPRTGTSQPAKKNPEAQQNEPSPLANRQPEPKDQVRTPAVQTPAVANRPAKRRSWPAAHVLKGKARITAGEWVVEGAELVHMGGEEGGVVFGSPDWADYDITVDLMFTSGRGGCRLEFRRISQSKSAGVINLEIGSKGCGIGHWVGENGRDLDERTLRLVRSTIGWYTARVEAHGRAKSSARSSITEG